MRPPLSQPRYIPLCFSDRPTVNGISSKPFPMGCLSIVASSFCSSIDIIGFCTTASMQIQLNHRPLANKQRNSNRIKAERPESNRRPERDSVSLPLVYIPHNPDSRVSKVFNVLCLNTRRFGLRQHRLYGRAPLRRLNSTVQLYAHKEGMPSCINGNGTCRKLRPLFNLMHLVSDKHCIFY